MGNGNLEAGFEIKHHFVCFADVIRSMIGTAIWITIITTWVVIFQKYRAEWGKIADDMSFIVPKGEL